MFFTSCTKCPTSFTYVSNCDGIYMGETGSAFCTRCKEHMRDVNTKNLARLENNDEINNKSALMKHVYLQNYYMDWNNLKTFIIS